MTAIINVGLLQLIDKTYSVGLEGSQGHLYREVTVALIEKNCKALHIKRKLSYRKGDCAMRRRPIYGCPEKFRES